MDWSRRRQRFNHDWLKNQFLTALAHLESVSKDMVEDPEFVARFFEVILPQWHSKRNEVLELAASFEAQMSPRDLFQHEPFALNAKMQEMWIADVIEALWRGRMQPEHRIAKLLNVVKECDSAWLALSQRAAVFGEHIDVEALEKAHRAFTHLAYSLTDFPMVVSIL